MTDDILCGWHIVTDIAHSGYGGVGLELRKQVHGQGISILPPDSFGWDVFVAVSPPRAGLVGPTDRPDLIFHTMFEAYPAPPRWVKVLNRVGLVWVPSQYSADVFKEGGVTTPIVVSGYGYDPSAFHPLPRDTYDEPFKLLIWGDNLKSRKNLLKAIQVFVLADLPDARLSVKVNDSTLKRGMTVNDEHGLAYANIEVITEPMPRHELINWLHSGHAILILTGGEGYSLINLEAMATGLPLITTRNTGILDYTPADVVYEVPSLGRGPAPSMVANYGIPHLQIEQPDVDAAVELLRYVYHHREEAAARGMRGYDAIHHLTWERAGEHAAELIGKFVASSGRLLEQTNVVY